MGFFKGLMDSIVGNYNEKEIKRMEKIVATINGYESSMQALSDQELKDKTNEFKGRINKGETLDEILPEAYAVVREAAVRSLGQRPFDVQMIGGIVLNDGRIAEMKTGEGKTITATLAVYLNALEGKGVHVITVNDYLASYQSAIMSKLYEFLGLTVGCVVHGVEGEDRKAAYRCDITYGTNNEFGFDYLRDNMVVHKSRMTQAELHYAIIDEVDSILIDEARTPLIISGNGVKTTDLYHKADAFVATLSKSKDVIIDEKAKSVVMTDGSDDEDGEPFVGTPAVTKAESHFAIENLSDPENMALQHHINQSLKARFIMKRDVDYVVKDNEVLIVDEFTGRLMMGRRYSNGLHQAIEAKENIEVRKETQTLATITLQNYFRMYRKLSGMTGTAKTEEDEFKHIYNMDVVIIPTNRPVVRDDRSDAIFKSIKGKYDAIVDDVIKHYTTGQPVLVGTVAIEVSEYLSVLLKKRGVPHEVLNAKHHNREAEIVAQAGRKGQVTIATNMAGRGTDIILGGNPEFMSKKDLRKKGFTDDIINKALSPLDYHDDEINECKRLYHEYFDQHKLVTDVESAEVKAAGGLHIIGTERHESRRIDNQLRGRSGRQGDPGSSQFFISLEDDLMRLFISDRAKDLVAKMGMDDDMQIEAGILSKSVEGAQKKVESRNFSTRKHVLQYDDVMNKQREIIYEERGRVLRDENLREHIQSMVEKQIDDTVSNYTSESEYGEEWDIKALEEHLHHIFLPKGLISNLKAEELNRESLTSQLKEIAKEKYATKESEVTSEEMRKIEQFVLLKIVDTKWIDHIDAMDQLKQGIGLRAIGQQDPVTAYKIEGFDMFGEMINNIQEETLRILFNVRPETEHEREQVARITSTSSHGSGQKPKTVVRQQRKVGRNEPCPCGSGKKYKKCCGAE